MNEIISTFFLSGNKFMPEVHLKQSEFTYGACRIFIKNKERIKKNQRNGRFTIYSLKRNR